MKLLSLNFVNSTGQIGNDTVGELRDWLQKYLNLYYPDQLGIWMENVHPEMKLDSEELMSKYIKNLNYFAVFDRRGFGCSRMIEIFIVTRDGSFKCIASAKYMSAEFSKGMVEAIEAVLYEIYLFKKFPLIVDYLELIPKDTPWSTETSLHEKVLVHVFANTIRVSKESGDLMYEKTLPIQEAGLVIPSMENDWILALKSMKCQYELFVDRTFELDSYPGKKFEFKNHSGEVLVIFPQGEIQPNRFRNPFPNLDSACIALK